MPYNFAQQTFPPLLPVNVPNFSIPFEIGESASTIREVELLVSQDRGKRWHSVARQPVESGKFAFHADSEGEYWFAFRTATANGTLAPFNGQPQLRVSVNTGEPMLTAPSRQRDSGPLTPPKPERFRPGNAAKPPTTQPENNDEPKMDTAEVKPEVKPVKMNTQETTGFLAPKLPGFVPPDPAKKRDGDLLEELLSGMSPFIDVEPVAVRAVPGNQVTANRGAPAPVTANVPKPTADSPAGNITSIALGPPAADKPQPQIVVRWNAGQEHWNDAQIDILRRNTETGQWSPVTTNLSNNGEYWWYVTPEDLKPFYVAVRIRSPRSGVRVDVTQSAIDVAPTLSRRESAVVP